MRRFDRFSLDNRVLQLAVGNRLGCATVLVAIKQVAETRGVIKLAVLSKPAKQQ